MSLPAYSKLVLLGIVFVNGLTLVSAGTSENWALHRLFARQSSGSDFLDQVPPQCQSNCSAIASGINACDVSTASPTCVCTNENGEALVSCISCIVGLSPNEEEAESGQAILNQFNAVCGSSISPLTLPPFTSSASSTPASLTTPATATTPRTPSDLPTSPGTTKETTAPSTTQDVGSNNPSSTQKSGAKRFSPPCSFGVGTLFAASIVAMWTCI